MRMKTKRFGSMAAATLLCLALLLCLSTPAFAADGFRYRHDPRLNASAMEDIIVDENAVYGFRPSETGSLKEYASWDWSDPERVDQVRQDRIAYHKGVTAMYDLLQEMTAEGCSIEEIARAVSTRRNEARLEAYADEPERLAAVKARNLEVYGHEEGPLPEELYEKYGSWETVLQKAFSINVGMDAATGLYDDYYYVYTSLSIIENERTAKAERQYYVAAFLDRVDMPVPETPAAALADFTDASKIADCYRPEWETAVSSGLIRGFADHTLRPTETVTRLQAFLTLSRCLPELEPTGEPIAFSDVPESARAEIDRLSAAGIVLGYGDGRLGAGDQLTVYQVSLLLDRVEQLRSEQG